MKPKRNTAALAAPKLDLPLLRSASDEGGRTVDSRAGRHRNGHVARLPKDIRLRINQMLDDGFTYARIIKDLGEHGKDLNEDIIYRWKTGGYQDYLRQQRLLDACRARRDRAFKLIRQPNPVVGFQATQQIAAAQICEIIADLGVEILREAIATNPLNYFSMLNAFTKLANGGLGCERHLADEAQRLAALAKQIVPKKGISPEAVKQMQDKLNL